MCSDEKVWEALAFRICPIFICIADNYRSLLSFLNEIGQILLTPNQIQNCNFEVKNYSNLAAACLWTKINKNFRSFSLLYQSCFQKYINQIYTRYITFLLSPLLKLPLNASFFDERKSFLIKITQQAVSPKVYFSLERINKIYKRTQELSANAVSKIECKSS